MKQVREQAAAGVEKATILTAESEGKKTFWWNELPKEMLTSETPPLVMSVAGLTCTDWSSLGKQQRGAGLQDRHHSVWREERRQVAQWSVEDMFFTENSERYLVQEKQVEALRGSHSVFYIRTGPAELGFPIRRSRTFSFAIRNEALAWVGPTSPEDIQAKFNSLFAKTCELTGDVYFCAEESTIESFVMQRAAKRRKPLPANFKQVPMEDYLERLVPNGYIMRKIAYDGLREEQGALNGDFLADLEQTANLGSCPGATVPPLNTHPDVFSYSKKRLATGIEYFAMQGLDCLPPLWG